MHLLAVAAPIVNATAQATSGAPRAKRVLIVEDQPLNLKLLHDLLEAQGYEILETGDGLEAINLARDNLPDLILMDIQLPDVSGLDVTRWLKEDARTRRIPIVAVTAFAMGGDEKKVLDSGADAYVAKPISVLSFLRTVQSFLR
jgi:two-component system cell cycle response regulator DivK